MRTVAFLEAWARCTARTGSGISARRAWRARIRAGRTRAALLSRPSAMRTRGFGTCLSVPQGAWTTSTVCTNRPSTSTSPPAGDRRGMCPFPSMGQLARYHTTLSMVSTVVMPSLCLHTPCHWLTRPRPSTVCRRRFARMLSGCLSSWRSGFTLPCTQDGAVPWSSWLWPTRRCAFYTTCV